MTTTVAERAHQLSAPPPVTPRVGPRFLETALLVIALLILLFAMVRTALVALRDDQHSDDLRFAGTTDELERMLELNGPERFGQMHSASMQIGGETLRVDTLVIVADSTVEPAVKVGGFLHDQVAAYNAHAIREALLRRGRQRRAGEAEVIAPSLFRSAWSEDGRRSLSQQLNPFVLTVRSPFAERNWRDVRTSDWQRRQSLLGLEGDLTLGKDVTDDTRVDLNRHPCWVRNRFPRMLLYCETKGAANVERFYDVGLLFSENEHEPRIVEAFTDRRLRVWHNGQESNQPTYPISAGDLFDLRRTGAFIISTIDHGTLAAPQWLNGRENFGTQGEGTITFFAAAGRTSGPPLTNVPVILSLDAAFARELEQQAASFLVAQRGVLERLSVVVMDVRTGELRAITEPERAGPDQALLAYEPILVGSVVKPMIASAILARRPELMRFTVDYAGDTVRVLRDTPLQRGFANDANGCAGSIDLDAFLRCSSNQYAAEFVVRSLEADGYHSRSAGDIVPSDVLEGSALGNGLAEAFDVDAFARRTTGRYDQVLISAADSSKLAQPVITNPVMAPWESRPWILFPETPGTKLDLLARYAFGGWENRWTLMGVSQAYARIATGRQVKATIVALPPGTSAAFAESPPRVKNAFARVRRALVDVGVGGTAAGLAANVRAATDKDMTVLAKTGTLNEVTGRFKSLALTVGKPANASADAALRCGLAVAMYFEFADEFRPAEPRQRLPSVHLQFANHYLTAALRKHWSRLSHCK